MANRETEKEYSGTGAKQLVPNPTRLICQLVPNPNSFPHLQYSRLCGSRG